MHPAKVKEVCNMKIMKAIIVVVGIAVLYTASAVAEEPDDTAKLFLEACKTGDVVGIEALTAGRYYDRIKVLLSKNREYSKYLRKIHQSVTMEIVDREVMRDKAVLTIRKVISDGGYRDSKIVLESFGGGNWKVTDEILE